MPSSARCRPHSLLVTLSGTKSPASMLRAGVPNAPARGGGRRGRSAHKFDVKVGQKAWGIVSDRLVAAYPNRMSGDRSRPRQAGV
jgi:hypothetical protein